MKTVAWSYSGAVVAATQAAVAVLQGGSDAGGDGQQADVGFWRKVESRGIYIHRYSLSDFIVI